ncbi:MAG: hypothetical protein ACYDER_17560 [Ktedonobacteraceae bacterium]
MTGMIIWASLVVTGFLCILNSVFAYIFRKRTTGEKLSYVVVGVLELLIFVVTLTWRLGLLHSIPFHLPQHLPFNRAEIAGAVAIGIGLFPAAYWHRTSMSQLRTRMQEDAQTMKQREANVHVRNSVPGEWMN